MAAAKVLQFSIIKLLHLVKRNEAISLPLALFHCLYLLAVKDKKSQFCSFLLETVYTVLGEQNPLLYFTALWQ